MEDNTAFVSYILVMTFYVTIVRHRKISEYYALSTRMRFFLKTEIFFAVSKKKELPIHT